MDIFGAVCWQDLLINTNNMEEKINVFTQTWKSFVYVIQNSNWCLELLTSYS